MADLEHLLVAEAGTDAESRYAIMVGVHVDDPAAVAARLTELGDGLVVKVLRDVSFEITIAFSSKQKLATFGDDGQYALLSQIVRHRFISSRPRPIEGYPLAVHLPRGIPCDPSWFDAYLSGASLGRVRVHTTIESADDRILALPRLVARLFLEALEDDDGRPGAARDRYDAIAPLVTHVEDIGLGVSYLRGGTGASSIVRSSLSS